MTDPRPASSHGRAAAFMLCGVLMLVLNDAAAKWLLARYDPVQIAFVRSLLALPLAALLILRFDGRSGFRSASLGLHALRGALVLVATLAFFGSLRGLGLAEAQSLLFTAPIIVAAIAALVLEERVDARRWTSVALGFAGALAIVRPGMATFRIEALLALSAAFLYALIMLSARRIDPRDSLWTMTFWTSVFSALCASIGLADAWPAPERADPVFFAAMAVLGTGGMALVSQAFRLAPASLVAPLDYTALLWASLLGWFVWGTVPGWPVWTGAAFIVAGGILLLKHE